MSVACAYSQLLRLSVLSDLLLILSDLLLGHVQAVISASKVS